MSINDDLQLAVGARRRFYARISGLKDWLWERKPNLAGSTTPPQGMQHPLDSACKGAWRMNAAAGATEPDVSGGSHDLSDANSNCGTGPGKFGTSREAYGSSGGYKRLQAADHADLRPTAITMAMWVYVADPTDQDINVATLWLEKREQFASWYNSYALGASHYSRDGYWPYAVFRLDDGGTGVKWEVGDSAGAGFDTAGWHHVGATFDTGVACVYLDGALATTDTHGSYTDLIYGTVSHGVLNVGKSLSSVGYWPGKYFDDLAIYNEAKTAAWFEAVWSAGLNCLELPEGECTAALDLATMRAEAGALELILRDVDDPDNAGESYFGKLFAPGLWSSVNAKATYLKRKALADIQLDADDTTIYVVKTTDYDSMDAAGEAHVAQETFAYSSKGTQATDTTDGYPATTLGTFAGCERGLYSAFDNPRGDGQDQWAVTLEYPRSPEMVAGDVGAHQPVSDKPFSWIGRHVGLYVTTLDTDNDTWQLPGELVWAGRISDSIQFKPRATPRCWTLTCENLLADLDRKLCAQLPEAKGALVNLSGQYGRQFIATAWWADSANDRVNCYAYRQVEIQAGYWELGSLMSEIQDQLTGTWTLTSNGSSWPFNWGWNCYAKGNRTRLYCFHKDGDSNDGRWFTIYPCPDPKYAVETLAYDDPGKTTHDPSNPCHALQALGFDCSQPLVLQTDDQGFAQIDSRDEFHHNYQPTHISCNGGKLLIQEQGTDYLWDTQGDYEAVGGSALAHLSAEAKINLNADKARYVIAYTAATDSTYYYNESRDSNHTITATELTLAEREHQPVDEIAYGADRSGYVGSGAGASAFTSVKIDWQQVYVPKYRNSNRQPVGPFAQLLPLLLSTGTQYYNAYTSTGVAAVGGPNYDRCPSAISCKIPGALIDIDSFKQADAVVRAAYPRICQRPLTVIDKPTSWLDLFAREGQLFGYAVVWSHGKLRCKPVLAPELQTAVVTLNDSNTAYPDDWPDIVMSVDTVINQRTYKINHDLLSGRATRTIIVNDRESIEGLGGIVKEASIEHPGIRYSSEAALETATQELTALMLQASHLVRLPCHRITRSLAPTLFNQIYVGDMVNIVATTNHPDPMGTGDYALNSIAMVLNVSWNLKELEGHADLLIMSRYDAAQATPWAPGAVVDRTAANAGFDSSTKALTLLAHAFGSSGTDDEDGEAFGTDGFKILIIPRAPADPTSTATISATVSASGYDSSSNVLYLDEDISGSWDTTGATEYIVTFADWDTIPAAQQSHGTWQAGAQDHLLNSTDPAQRYG